MLRNYLIVAYRNLMGHKVYSVINVAGLSIGIAFCILTFLYVRNEWTYDAFHENAERIYRVYFYDHSGASSMTPDPLGPALGEAFPDVQAVRYGFGARSAKYQDRTIRAKIRFADPAILDVFTFPLLQGDPATVLEDPSSLVVTEAAARKYFGDEDPLGKVLSLNLWGPPAVVRDFVVTGVAKTIPKNSSIQFDFLATFASRGEPKNWNISDVATYALLSENEVYPELSERFSELVRNLIPPWRGERWDGSIGLLPLLEMHLNRDKGRPTGRGDPAFSYILLGIALLVLTIACVNFVTFAVGRSFSRDREVAMRKVTGASRIQLLIQFLGESMVLCAFALLAGLGLAELLLPAFESVVVKDLTLRDQADGAGIAFLVGLAVAVGLAAGGYPALVLSNVQPAAALKGRIRLVGSNRLGRVLVVLQFTLSVFLVASALTMVKQLEYLKKKPLGFNTEHVLRIQAWYMLNRDAGQIDVYRNELMRHHAVIGITTTTHALSNRTRYSSSVEYLGEELNVEVVDVGNDFLKTMGISLLEGSDFNPQNTKPTSSIILNETLVRRLGWETPVIGRTLRMEERDLKVIGVVQDFHVRSLHHSIPPAVMRFDEKGRGALLVRIRSENVPGTLAYLETKWREVAPEQPLQYSFLDNEVDGQYKKEERWSRVLRNSALFAVLIACLGAFGLTALAVARRTREIGIRKVLGAHASGIVALLSRDFVKHVVIASLIAFPTAYYATERWLQDFAYRIDPDIPTFALGGGFVLLAVLLTVSVQAIRAAWANPVDALRTE
ncbi:MAG: ABC transporter permease [Gemmatimonadota bacterium]|nr:ABC transporter permease [Gemmatimonadota bacterium]